ncbi:MAG: Sensor histidine kinase [Acidobacteria bacterium]|jgi:hypothetical protein|nr:Sensor histidine kinase [Acidobacteriota bacterium]
MNESNENLVEADIAVIRRIEGIRMILKVLRRVSGMRLVFVARVTKSSWTACAVLDEAEFGLSPGDTLDLATTY